MAKKKRYSSVVEMARDITEDDAFADDLAQRLDRKQVVRTLLALRAARNLSQKDVAAKMGCTQSRISKLESSLDDDLRFGDLEAYTKALGLNLTLVLFREGVTAVDQVKYHAFCIKKLLDYLARLASKDGEISKGVFRFFGETFHNLTRLIFDAAKNLQVEWDALAPPVGIMTCGDEVEDRPDEKDESGKTPTLAPV